ncbi:tetratricopeptide repeat protein [Planctomicrobium sp. SH668]|uniref:tetratricopeptide repeat protein n=1 Tax=Planctomicrobium sp. SH668 TaxID=3448126 RepID=UPI003F5B8914
MVDRSDDVAQISVSESPVLHRQQYSISSDEPSELLNQARECMEDGDLKRAERICQSLLEKNSEDSQAWNLMGEIAFRQGPVEASIPLFRTAIRIDSTRADFHHNLGFAYLKSRKLANAVDAIEEAIRMNPFNVDSWTAMSEALWLMGDETPSFDCLRQALQLDPQSLTARTLFADIQLQRGDLRSALLHFQFVLKRDPENAVISQKLKSIAKRMERAGMHD